MQVTRTKLSQFLTIDYWNLLTYSLHVIL